MIYLLFHSKTVFITVYNSEFDKSDFTKNFEFNAEIDCPGHQDFRNVWFDLCFGVFYLLFHPKTVFITVYYSEFDKSNFTKNFEFNAEIECLGHQDFSNVWFNLRFGVFFLLIHPKTVFKTVYNSEFDKSDFTKNFEFDAEIDCPGNQDFRNVWFDLCFGVFYLLFRSKTVLITVVN